MQKILNISKKAWLRMTNSRGCKIRARIALRRQAPNTRKPVLSPIKFYIFMFFLINYSNFHPFIAEGRFALKAYTGNTSLFTLASYFTTYYQFRLLLAIILRYKIGIGRPRSAMRAPRRAHGGLARPTQHSIIISSTSRYTLPLLHFSYTARHITYS